MRKLGIVVFLLVLALGDAGTAFGISQNCYDPQVKKYTFHIANHQSVYTAYRSCFKYWEDGDSETYLVTVTGTWDAANGVATETGEIRVKYYEDGALKNDQTYSKKTSADCPSDPWQNQVDCTNNWLIPPWPIFWFSYPPYPITAQGLKASDRNYLKNRFADAQRKAAPEILLPKQNQKYANGQLLFEARVSVPDNDDPGQWKVEIEAVMDPSQPSATPGTFKASRVVTGVGTAWIYKDLPYNGFWLVRGRSTSPKHASDWSGQARFEIAGSKGPLVAISAEAVGANFVVVGKSGTLGEPPSMGPSITSPTPGQIVTVSVKVRAVPPPGAGTTQVKLEFEWYQGGGLWQKFLVLDGYDTAALPDGYALGKSKFPKMGAWRVRARVAKPNMPWCAPVEFKVK